jgi:hypothetical protein
MALLSTGSKGSTNTLISSQLDRELLLTTIEQFKVYVKSPFKLFDFIATSNKSTSSRCSSLAPSPLVGDDFSTPSSILGDGIVGTAPKSFDSNAARNGLFEEYIVANMAKSFLQLLGKNLPQVLLYLVALPLISYFPCLLMVLSNRRQQ